MKASIIILVLVLLVGGILLLSRNGQKEQDNTPTTPNNGTGLESGGGNMADQPAIPDDSAGTSTNSDGDSTGMVEAPNVEVSVTGKGFEFSVKEIRASVGDTVTVNFSSLQGFHDWTVDEFSAATSQVNAGESSSVTFVVDKAGEYEYYCSVGTHRQMGMVGKLIVE
jgi:plastocyanin